MRNMMKTGYLFAFVTFFVLLSVRAIAAPEHGDAFSPDPKNLKLASANVLIVETDNNARIYEKKSAEPVPIASLTKLMTAMVVLDAGLPPDELLNIDAEDLDYIKGSRSRLGVGGQLTRAEMLRLALMSSENRAAAALSRHYPGGRLAFMAAMNDKAHQLGMRQTSFADSTGLSPENISTAQDLAVMVTAAARYPLIREYSTTARHTVAVEPAGRTLGYQNSNRLVRADNDWEILLQKTGYINEAGRCLVMLARIAQREFVIVLLDSVGKYTRLGDAQRVKSWIETGIGSDLPKAAVKTASVKSGKAKAQPQATKTAKKNVQKSSNKTSGRKPAQAGQKTNQKTKKTGGKKT